MTCIYKMKGYIQNNQLKNHAPPQGLKKELLNSLNYIRRNLASQLQVTTKRVLVFCFRTLRRARTTFWAWLRFYALGQKHATGDIAPFTLYKPVHRYHISFSLRVVLWVRYPKSTDMHCFPGTPHFINTNGSGSRNKEMLYLLRQCASIHKEKYTDSDRFWDCYNHPNFRRVEFSQKHDFSQVTYTSKPI